MATPALFMSRCRQISVREKLYKLAVLIGIKRFFVIENSNLEVADRSEEHTSELQSH